jgi:single-strand DNA-binding protein
MSNLNKVFLMGNLTRDPELKYTPAGVAICAFGMAINRTWKGGDGEKKEEVCYVDISMWGRRGEVINEYFKKGNPIFIEGRLQFQQWETKDGQKRNALRVVAESFEFISGTKGAVTSVDSSSSKPTDINDEEIPF